MNSRGSSTHKSPGSLLAKASFSLFMGFALLGSCAAEANPICEIKFGGGSNSASTSASGQASAADRPGTDNARAATPAQASVDDEVSAEAATRRSWWRGFRKPVDFDAEVSAQLKAQFIQKIILGVQIDPLQLTTLNEKVAWIDANSATRGENGDIFHLIERFQNASPAEKRTLARAFKNIDFSEKISWTQADKLAVKLYLLTSFDPSNYGIFRLFKTRWGAGVAEQIRYRSALSAARYGLVEGLKEQGLLRKQSSRDRIHKRLQAWMVPIDIAWSVSISALTFYVPFMGTRSPKLLYRSSDLSPEANRRYLNSGYSAIRVDAETNYGTSARVQQGLILGERALAAAFLPIMAVLFYDEAKILAELAYDIVAPNDPLGIREEEEDDEDKKKVPKVFKLPPGNREAIIKKLYENDRQTLIDTRAPLFDETESERIDRIAAVDHELKEAKRLESFEKLTDLQLVQLNEKGSLGAVEPGS